MTLTYYVACFMSVLPLLITGHCGPNETQVSVVGGQGSYCVLGQPCSGSLPSNVVSTNCPGKGAINIAGESPLSRGSCCASTHSSSLACVSMGTYPNAQCIGRHYVTRKKEQDKEEKEEKEEKEKREKEKREKEKEKENPTSLGLAKSTEIGIVVAVMCAFFLVVGFIVTAQRRRQLREDEESQLREDEEDSLVHTNVHGGNPIPDDFWSESMFNDLPPAPRLTDISIDPANDATRLSSNNSLATSPPNSL